MIKRAPRQPRHRNRQSLNQSANVPQVSWTAAINTTKARITTAFPVTVDGLPAGITNQGVAPTAITVISPNVFDLTYLAAVIATNTLVVPNNVQEIKGAAGVRLLREHSPFPLNVTLRFTDNFDTYPLDVLTGNDGWIASGSGPISLVVTAPGQVEANGDTYGANDHLANLGFNPQTDIWLAHATLTAIPGVDRTATHIAEFGLADDEGNVLGMDIEQSPAQAALGLADLNAYVPGGGGHTFTDIPFPPGVHTVTLSASDAAITISLDGNVLWVHAYTGTTTYTRVTIFIAQDIDAASLAFNHVDFSSS